MCTGATTSTDLISTITKSSTIRSARNPHLDPGAMIDHRNWLLADRAQTALFQFVRQDSFIDRFQQSRAKRCMHAESRVHDLLRHLIFCHVRLKKRISRKAAKTQRKPSTTARLEE